jgi:aminoglycoside 3-N-acetyltransferase
MTNKGDADGLTKQEIIDGLQAIGLKQGDVVLIHTAMRTFGHIDGGAATAVEAFLEVLGPRGTLVAPAFTFCHEGEDDPVIDPRQDRSEMGTITEAVRQHPQALRSTAYRHSFSALGRRARVITEVDPALSSFDLRSSFGVMLALDTQVVLCGLTYQSSTSHHFAELVCDVSYRETIPLTVKVRLADGSIIDQPMTDYQPRSEGGSYYGTRHPDFIRLGQMLEERGLVGTAFIGNAAVRRFSLRELVGLAEAEAARDENIFRSEEGQEGTTELTFGTKFLSPEMVDGAGRAVRFEWCVKDVDKLVLP